MEKNRAGSLLLIIFLSAFVMEEVSASTPTGTVSINNNQTGFSTTNWTGDLFVGKFTNVPAGAKITAVGINVATAAGNIRVKVFDDNAGLPNNLLAESASIPVPGRGIQSISLTTSATTPSNGIVWVGFEVDSSSFVTVFKSVAVQKLWFPHTYGAGPSTASALGLATTFPNLLIYYNTSQIPLAPSTLTTSAISNSQIHLNWSTSTGATWYKIDRESPQGAGFSTIVVNTTNSTTHYDDTGLAAGTQYNYRVWAGNGTGTSTNSTIHTTPPTVSASPESGIYTSAQSVTLTASEPSIIYYTTDGSTPTISSPVYSSPVSISTTSTLKFFAKDTAGNIGNTVTASYTIDTTPPTVSASPVSGTYNSIQSVTITASEPSIKYYTTDDIKPTISSTSSPSPISGISISTSTTLKYFAKDTAGNIGNTVTASYTISIPDTTAPVITPTGTVSINNNQTGFSTTNWTGDLFVGKFTNVPAGAKITAVGINVATAAGNIRVKVFDDNAGLPNNLLPESASIPVPGRGIQSISL